MQSSNNLFVQFGQVLDRVVESSPTPNVTLPNLCVHLLGRRITLMTTPEILKSIDLACTQNRRITVANYNTHAFNLSMQLPWFYSFLQQSELVHCDGAGILRGLRWLGLTTSPDYRVSYSEMMPQLLAQCDRASRRVFLLGTKPEYLDGALTKLREQICRATWLLRSG
jgi:N-acetylglucosaminyldiphosphoundecaprenol N-acetyl-beta-D-mannosaminyltransferase